MFHNINMRTAQGAIVRQPKSYGSTSTKKVLNDQFLQRVGQIRGLEDKLLALQYQKQLLIDQNHAYKDSLDKLTSNNQVQENRMRRLEEEAQIYRIKNQELYNCQENLKSLYAEIDQLTSLADKKNTQIHQMQSQKARLIEQNERLFERKKALIERKNIIDIKIQDYFKLCQFSHDFNLPLLSSFKIRLQDLLSQLSAIKLEQQKINQDKHYSLNIEIEQLTRLQYEQKLLIKRLQDSQKNQQIARMCQNQNDLEGIVQDMLIKEDQLIQELKQLTIQFQEDERYLRETIQRAEDEWAEKRDSMQRQIRQMKQMHSKICYETSQLDIQIEQKLQKQRYMAAEYELISKLKLNLSSMQRLRELEQKNNHLKLKIKNCIEIKELLSQQRQIIPIVRYTTEIKHESRISQGQGLQVVKQENSSNIDDQVQ